MLDIIFLPACLVWRCALPSITKLIHKILGTLAKGKKKKKKNFLVYQCTVLSLSYLMTEVRELLRDPENKL
jgi:hypothetical protein